MKKVLNDRVINHQLTGKVVEGKVNLQGDRHSLVAQAVNCAVCVTKSSLYRYNGRTKHINSVRHSRRICSPQNERTRDTNIGLTETR